MMSLVWPVFYIGCRYEKSVIRQQNGQWPVVNYLLEMVQRYVLDVLDIDRDNTRNKCLVARRKRSIAKHRASVYSYCFPTYRQTTLPLPPPQSR